MCAGQGMPTREWTACWTNICALAGTDKGDGQRQRWPRFRDAESIVARDGSRFGTEAYYSLCHGFCRMAREAFGFGSVQVWLGASN